MFVTVSGVPLLSPHDLSVLRQQGFLVQPRVANERDLVHLSQSLRSLLERFDQLPENLAVDLGDEEHPKGAPQIPEINMVSDMDPTLRETELFSQLSELARQILGSRCTFLFDHAIFKPPFNETSTPWHQDGAFYRYKFLPPNNVYFWVPMQDVTVDNGCMHYIPGSHLGPLFPHHKRGHNPDAHSLTSDYVDPSTAVACPVRAGGCTVHFAKTFHYSGPNRSSALRIAWILHFGIPRKSEVIRRWRELVSALVRPSGWRTKAT